MECKAIRLSHFIKMFDRTKMVGYEMEHSKNLQAYKFGHSWYVDLEKFEAWKDQTHRNSYKYVD